MGKLAGSICILVGCLVLLLRWTESVRQRESLMREIVRFFRRWEYALETKQMRVLDFLAAYPYAEGKLRELTETVREKLLTHTYPAGQIVWKKALEESQSLMRLSEDAYQILLRAGDSFFGTNRMEAAQCVRACIRQMEMLIEEERKSYREKRKVYMPVGMLTGVMFVILLL